MALFSEDSGAKCPLARKFSSPQKVGLLWSVPFSCKESDRAWSSKGGGGEHVIGGGGCPKPLLERGFYGMFSLVFSTPSLTLPINRKLRKVGLYNEVFGARHI